MGLFSTTTHHHSHDNRTVFPNKIEVTEKRAPTDESLRLVQEMEDKVKATMLAKLTIQSNVVSAVAIVYYKALPYDKTTYHIKFNLNGKDYKIEHDIDNWQWNVELRDMWGGFGNQAVFKLFHKTLSEIIAIELMKQSPDFMNELGKNQ